MGRGGYACTLAALPKQMLLSNQSHWKEDREGMIGGTWGEWVGGWGRGSGHFSGVQPLSIHETGGQRHDPVRAGVLDQLLRVRPLDLHHDVPRPGVRLAEPRKVQLI